MHVKNNVVSSKDIMGYDIIGDVHGCAQSLRQLLEKLGYVEADGAYVFDNGALGSDSAARQVIFVGDVIDRGPQIRDALQIARAMVERGSARMILGNHEYNALAYCTLLHASTADQPQFVREHTVRHTLQIQETLDQFRGHDDEWRDMLRWFMTLPLFLDLPQCRVVHACWDERLIESLLQRRGHAFIDADFLQASADRHSFERSVIDRLTRGLDLQLPEGAAISGRDGFTRRMFRAKFWADNAQTYQELAFQPDPLPDHVATLPISDADRGKLLYYGADAKPLFVGHYWRQGTPRPLLHNLACLDYSAVHRGKLTAYRMDAETSLDTARFVWVDARDDENDG
jgi:Calcineurin-like phosphoesterase